MRYCLIFDQLEKIAHAVIAAKVPLGRTPVFALVNNVGIAEAMVPGGDRLTPDVMRGWNPRTPESALQWDQALKVFFCLTMGQYRFQPGDSSGELLTRDSRPGMRTQSDPPGVGTYNDVSIALTLKDGLLYVEIVDWGKRVSTSAPVSTIEAPATTPVTAREVFATATSELVPAPV